MQQALKFNQSILTSAEVAAMLGVSQHAVNRWRVDCAGPPFTYTTATKRITYEEADVVQWLDEYGRDWLAQNANHRSKKKATTPEEFKLRHALNARRYHEKNPEKHREWRAKWRAANLEKARASASTWAKANPHSRLATQRKIKYGLDARAFESLWEQQSELCAICNQRMEHLGHSSLTVCVDHDHITNSVRSLLCSGCNKGIGYFKDDPERLESAAAYLRRWKNASSTLLN